MRQPETGTGFTLIELLIVVAIIGILASIAIPSFVQARIRAKVARVNADLNTLATAIESFRVDHQFYPVGTDDQDGVPSHVWDHFSQYGAYAFYTFRIAFPEGPLGTAMPGLTTPVPYIGSIPGDPFTNAEGLVTYSYREDRDPPLGSWIATSFGPDLDEADNAFKGNTVGPPFATHGGRHGDISERHGYPGSSLFEVSRMELIARLREVTYDPSNGVVSNGDLWRIGP